MRQATGTACPVPGRWECDALAEELTDEERSNDA